MATLLHKGTLFFLITGFFRSVFSIIVWNNTIVTEWPEQPLQFLSKSVAASTPSPEGFGLFTRPTGKIYGLTMIIDFSDEPAAFTKEQVGDWLNKPGYSTKTANGSVRDYYYECSNGKLELINDVVGYYRAKNPKLYYESGSDYAKADELVAEVIGQLDATVDFSKYDNDGDGTTEAINFVYSGSGNDWGKGLWPHSGYYGRKCDNVVVGKYSMSDMAKSLSLYVFCHETGHMLFGWPDLYWFGDYCLMGNRMSDVNPQAINDFFRADQGWIPTTDIHPADNRAFIARHNGGGFRYVNPSASGDMLYWSVVNDTGRWSSVRGRGILIYHFDKRIKGNTSGAKRTLWVVEADGDNDLAAQQWPSPGYESGDFFSAQTQNVFAATTKPASSWGLRIYDIGNAGDVMNFKVGTGVVNTRGSQNYPAMSLTIDRQTTRGYDLLGRLSGSEVTKGNVQQSTASGYWLYIHDGRSYRMAFIVGNRR